VPAVSDSRGDRFPKTEPLRRLLNLQNFVSLLTGGGCGCGEQNKRETFSYKK
jgi:hypothetical protein